jgi:hypothetical protein
MNPRRFAQIISLIFHPVFFSLFIPFLIVHKVTGNILYSLKWTGFSAGFLLIAVILFYLIRPKEFLSDFDITHREQRHIFYSITLLAAVLYFIASLLFKGILFPLSIISLGLILGLVSFDIINYYIKASIHMAVVSAYVVSVALIYGLIPFFIFVWLLLLVGWARLYLSRHSQAEVLAGMLLGAFIPIVTYFIAMLLG